MSLPTNFFIGRGGARSVLGIEAAQGSVNEVVYDGVTFYESAAPSSQNNATLITLTTVPGNQFYIAMVGAGGGGHKYGSGKGGYGATGLALVTVPAGVTTMTAFIGGRGDYQSSGAKAYGGGFFGGHGGDPQGSYRASSSGGGITALITGGTLATNTRNSTLICCVGSGGGAGAGAPGGHGGGFNRSGLDGNLNSHNIAHGSGGGLASGGVAAANYPGHTSGNQTNGGIYQGGQGSNSQYDGGAGAGAGYYGGGGGQGGGGYDGGASGGGSGFLDTNKASSIFTQDGGPGSTNIPSNAASLLNPQINTYGANSYGFASDFGRGGTEESDGSAGFVVMWNAA